VVPVLLSLLNNVDQHIRQAAAEALGQIGGKQASAVVPALLPLLREPELGVRQAAVGALGKLFLSQQKHEASRYKKLMSQLSGRDSQFDARYRLATVQALARWYNAGRPDAQATQTSQTASNIEGTGPTNPQAQHEHAQLQQELESLCYDQPRLWLRSAACQVLIEASDLRKRDKNFR
jgi:hypothetical protein